MIRLFTPLYELAWFIARPFLKRSPRVSLGWEERTLKKTVEGPFDLWIQSASGGESLLTNMVLENLCSLLPEGKKLRVLVSSGTKQGVDSLSKGRDNLSSRAAIEINVIYFPFDSPHLMQRAFSIFAPRLAIIIETELWPGFLIAAKQHNVPVLLVNGRMSEKSFKSYMHFSTFFRKYGPERVWAISRQDGDRFSQVVGADKVELMNNIKFDRIKTQSGPVEKNPIVELLPQDVPFVLLGSIRRQEELKILNSTTELLQQRTDCIVGLFPKHIERADHWIELLDTKRIKAIKRSEATGCQPAGTVIVWDVFGELAGAYSLAKVAFVGGSLENLGGQNFLEPLVFGLKPIIGPYWKNFAWVGREIISSGLVHEISNEKELLIEILRRIETGDSRPEVTKQVADFFEPRKGGTQQICQQIIKKLTVE